MNSYAGNDSLAHSKTYNEVNASAIRGTTEPRSNFFHMTLSSQNGYHNTTSPTLTVATIFHPNSSDSTIDMDSINEIQTSFISNILEFLHFYYIPFIIFVGFVGNILSCIVFLCTHLHLRSSSYYLAALAMADLGFLVTLLLVWFSNVGIEVFNQNGWCQLVIYMSSVCSFLSVWLIVGFTVERFIAVQYPLQRPQMCTVKRAKTTIACLSSFAFFIHAYLLHIAGLVPANMESNEGEKYCGLRNKFLNIMYVINVLDTFGTLILPLFLIVLMNSLIVRQLYKFSCKHRNNPLNEISSYAVSHASQAPEHSGQHSSRSGSSQTTNNNKMNKQENPDVPVASRHRNILTQRTQYTITKLLVLISTVFLILNLPSYVFRIYSFVLDTWDIPHNDSAYFMQQFSMLLYYTNFSVNFLLYSTYGVSFRRALLQLLRKKLHLFGRERSNSLQFK